MRLDAMVRRLTLQMVARTDAVKEKSDFWVLVMHAGKKCSRCFHLIHVGILGRKGRRPTDSRRVRSIGTYICICTVDSTVNSTKVSDAPLPPPDTLTATPWLARALPQAFGTLVVKSLFTVRVIINSIPIESLD